jgi:hypothetical protein
MLEDTSIGLSVAAEVQGTSEEVMVGQERWQQIRRLHFEGHQGFSQIARAPDLDR